MSLNEKIARHAKEARLSQSRLADLVGVSQSVMSKWMLGKTIPNVYEAAAIAKVLGVSLDYLVDDRMDIVEPAEGEQNVLMLLRALRLPLDEAMRRLATPGEIQDLMQETLAKLRNALERFISGDALSQEERESLVIETAAVLRILAMHSRRSNAAAGADGSRVSTSIVHKMDFPISKYLADRDMTDSTARRISEHRFIITQAGEPAETDPPATPSTRPGRKGPTGRKK